MAMETTPQGSVRNASGLGLNHAAGPSTSGLTLPGVPVVGREAALWLLARVADGGGEVMLWVEADERFWRARRTVGATGSMFELALATPASSTDVATALVRWASTAGLTGRLLADATGPVRVRLARVHD